MERSRFSDEQIIGILKEQESGMLTVEVPSSQTAIMRSVRWHNDRQVSGTKPLQVHIGACYTARSPFNINQSDEADTPLVHAKTGVRCLKANNI
jgi:hypothetical protein